MNNNPYQAPTESEPATVIPAPKRTKKVGTRIVVVLIVALLIISMFVG